MIQGASADNVHRCRSEAYRERAEFGSVPGASPLHKTTNAQTVNHINGLHIFYNARTSPNIGIVALVPVDTSSSQ